MTDEQSKLAYQLWLHVLNQLCHLCQTRIFLELCDIKVHLEVLKISWPDI